MSKRLRAFGMLLLSCSMAGQLASCGGPVQQIQVSSPFTEEHAKYFEDGIDFVQDPTTLDGRWREEWQAEMEKRVELSDLIAHVTVETVRSHWDLDRTMLQLELSIQKRIHGRAPSGPLSVTVRDGDPGFPSVKSNESRMLKMSYVLFVKWYADDLGQPIPHWHLSPEEVMGTVESRVQMLYGAASSEH